MIDYSLFGESARQAMVFAQNVASRYRNPYVSSEHFLWGLIDHPSYLACRVFRRMGIRPSRIKDALRSHMPQASMFDIEIRTRSWESESTTKSVMTPIQELLKFFGEAENIKPKKPAKLKIPKDYFITPRTQRMIKLARDCMVASNAARIESPMIILAIIRSDSDAGKILRSMGVTADSYKMALYQEMRSKGKPCKKPIMTGD